MKNSIDTSGRESIDGQFAHLVASVALILSSCAPNIGNLAAGQSPVLRERAKEEMADQREHDVRSGVDDELKKQRLDVALTAFRARIKDSDLKRLNLGKIFKEAIRNGRFGSKVESNINGVRVVAYYDGAPEDCRGDSASCERKYKIPDFQHLEIIFIFEFNGRIYEFHFHRSRHGDRGTNFDSEQYNYQVIELYPGISNNFGNFLASGHLWVPDDRISDKVLADCIIQQCREAASSVTCKEACVQKAYDERPSNKFRDKMPKDLRWLYEYCRKALERAF